MSVRKPIRDLRSAARVFGREFSGASGARVAVMSHERPDGDALGSTIALAAMLRSRGLKAVPVSDGVSRRFKFLKGARSLKSPRELAGRIDVAIAVDATGPERLGFAREVFERAGRKLVIDHHASNAIFGDVNWVDPRTSAVGEMLFALAGRLEWKIPPAAAEALYVAIVTDTGKFSFGNTTPEAFEMAAELVRGGVDPERVCDAVYGNRPASEWELEARLRSSLRLEAGGRIATVELGIRDFEETKTTPAAAQDFASMPRTLEGVELGIFFYEIDGGATTKVGFRSKRTVDVNKLAATLGGGGHPQASGCKVAGRIAKAKRVVLRAAKRHLGAGGTKRRRR